MGQQRNIKRERIKKEAALKQLQEITISQVKTLAFLTGYQKFCKEKNLEFDSTQYVSNFVKELKDENGNIDLKKLDAAIKEFGGKE